MCCTHEKLSVMTHIFSLKHDTSNVKPFETEISWKNLMPLRKSRNFRSDCKSEYCMQDLSDTPGRRGFGQSVPLD